MIEVRRRIQRIGPHRSRPAFGPKIFRSRYLQHPRFDQLPTGRIEALGKVLADRPELEAAWRLLQHLYGIYAATDGDEANQALDAFIDTYQQHPLPEFHELTETLLEWGHEILAFHDTNRASTAGSKEPTTASASSNASPTDSPTPTTSQPEHSSSRDLWHHHHDRARGTHPTPPSRTTYLPPEDVDFVGCCGEFVRDV